MLLNLQAKHKKQRARPGKTYSKFKYGCMAKSTLGL